MDFGWSEEQQAVRQAVRGALEKLLPRRDELVAAVHRDKRFPQEVWDIFAETGMFGALLPEEYGGTALGLTAMAIATEEAARLGFGNTVAILTAMDALCILRNGSEELKRRILPAVAEGKLKLAFAVTEPDAGSNTFRIKTTARREGDHYVINGQKTYITGLDHCDYVLLVVRTTPIEEAVARGGSKAYGLSLLLVPTAAGGLTMHPMPMRGIEGMNQYTVFFDNVRCPRELLVGEEDMGSFALFNTLNPERILAAAAACGMADWLLDRACAYARERRVFKDRPIGAYQAVQHPLAESRIELEAARLLTYRAAWAFDQDLDLATIGTYANMAKLTAADMAIRACDRAIETFGGAGFSEEYGVIYLWDAVRLLKTAPVTREMILNYVAEHVLELPRSY
ncbi:MAG: acyl-CoA dehydrogenase [Planctomycetota bacterium]|nr:MAG: acyl-CoA dehydrogenase [Planctomycetota bacterium]